MADNINLLSVLLLCTGLGFPLLFVLARYLTFVRMDGSLQSALRYWIYFLYSLVGVRVLMGLFLIVTDIRFYAVAKFYPIRIAYPNYGLFRGLPYVLLCIGMIIYVKPIMDFIIGNRWKYFLLGVFSATFLLFFGAIHGGFVIGNAWMTIAPEHFADATLNSTIYDVFATHANRIAGIIKPAYRAAHTLSHPAGSLAYWHVMTHNTTPIIFAMLNVLLFSLAFPAMYWALNRRFDCLTTFQSVIACLFIPAMLIYGRSDDAVYYSFAAIIASLVSVAVNEKKYMLIPIAACLFVVAINFSYASIVLLPLIFSFIPETRLDQIWQYVRRIIPHLLILIALIFVGMVLESSLTPYKWLDAFNASAHRSNSGTFLFLILHGEYLRAISDRIMAIFDFLIFAGPLFLYIFICLIKSQRKPLGAWRIKSLALLIILSVFSLYSLGPGELARPWGSLFLLIGFFWLPEFLAKESQERRWLLIKMQVAWALALQVFINFSL